MAAPETQSAKATPFCMERREGRSSSIVIFRFSGAFIAREMCSRLTPRALEEMLNFQSTPDEKAPELNILDLTEVPYMDSAGLGMLIRHAVRCKGKGVRLFAVGVNARVMQLFQLTKADTVIPIAASVEAVG
jgi:anti-sigma B factor antagonist